MSEFRKSDKVGGFRRKREFSGNASNKAEANDLKEKVVHINRCAKVVKGGRRFGFAALVVVGDQNGRLGVGYGKAKEVPEAIKKGTEKAKKNIVSYGLYENTVPHMAIGISDGGKVLLRPAATGTGVIAGGGVRAVLETLGVKDVLTKSMGSNNPFSVVRATINALKKMRTPAEIKAMKSASCDNN